MSRFWALGQSIPRWQVSPWCHTLLSALPGPPPQLATKPRVTELMVNCSLIPLASEEGNYRSKGDRPQLECLWWATLVSGVIHGPLGCGLRAHSLSFLGLSLYQGWPISWVTPTRTQLEIFWQL
jgi:hypothetical protein